MNCFLVKAISVITVLFIFMTCSLPFWWINMIICYIPITSRFIARIQRCCQNAPLMTGPPYLSLSDEVGRANQLNRLIIQRATTQLTRAWPSGRRAHLPSNRQDHAITSFVRANRDVIIIIIVVVAAVSISNWGVSTSASRRITIDILLLSHRSEFGTAASRRCRDAEGDHSSRSWVMMERGNGVRRLLHCVM